MKLQISKIEFKKEIKILNQDVVNLAGNDLQNNLSELLKEVGDNRRPKTIIRLLNKHIICQIPNRSQQNCYWLTLLINE